MCKKKACLAEIKRYYRNDRQEIGLDTNIETIDVYNELTNRVLIVFSNLMYFYIFLKFEVDLLLYEIGVAKMGQ